VWRFLILWKILQQNMSEDTDWQRLNMSENTDSVWIYLRTQTDSLSEQGDEGTVWVWMAGHSHNWCTGQMRSWFVIVHRAMPLLYCYIGLFGRHLLWHMVVKYLSGHCYHIPTSCLLSYPSYQIILIVQLPIIPGHTDCPH